MNTRGKTVAWICIFSILLCICYSSSMIDPTGDDTDKVYSNRIEFIITNDGTKYECDAPPAISRNSIVGVQ